MKSTLQQNKRLESKIEAFTLVEVVIAAALLALAFSMLIGSFIAGRRSTTLANNRVEALNEARSQVEKLLSLSYADPDLTPGITHTFPTTFSNKLTGSYTVTENPNFTDTKDIAVTVTWMRPGSSATSSVQLNATTSKAIHQ